MNAARVTDAGGNSLRSSPRCQHTQCAAVWDMGNEGQGLNPGNCQGGAGWTEQLLPEKVQKAHPEPAHVTNSRATQEM